MHKRRLVALAAILLVSLSGCTTSQEDAQTPAQSTTPTQPDTSPQSTTATPNGPAGEDQVNVTRLRFSTGDAEIVVRVADNPTSRDFVSKLPLSLTFEEFAGREKISYLPEELTTEGSPGAAARNGDLIYYVPWGNLGFFYNADPNGGTSDDVIAIGTVESGLDQLNQLEQGQVTAEVIE